MRFRSAILKRLEELWAIEWSMICRLIADSNFNYEEEFVFLSVLRRL